MRGAAFVACTVSAMAKAAVTKNAVFAWIMWPVRHQAGIIAKNATERGPVS